MAAPIINNPTVAKILVRFVVGNVIGNLDLFIASLQLKFDLFSIAIPIACVALGLDRIERRLSWPVSEYNGCCENLTSAKSGSFKSDRIRAALAASFESWRVGVG